MAFTKRCARRSLSWQSRHTLIISLLAALQVYPFVTDMFLYSQSDAVEHLLYT